MVNKKDMHKMRSGLLDVLWPMARSKLGYTL